LRRSVHGASVARRRPAGKNAGSARLRLKAGVAVPLMPLQGMMSAAIPRREMKPACLAAFLVLRTVANWKK
jgi:hypothetical protein